MRIFFLCIAVGIVGRLWILQVRQHETYVLMAASQQVRDRVIESTRGTIFATEQDGQGNIREVPLAVTRNAWLVFADTRGLADPTSPSAEIASLLRLPEDEVREKLSHENDPYIPLKSRVGDDVVALLKEKKIPGIHFEAESERFYPNSEVGSHILGFVRYTDDGMKGQYGIEQSFDDLLRGESGRVTQERDARGSWIALGKRELTPVEHGADIVLTIDWTLQYRACRALSKWVAQHGASGGSLVVLDPTTGAVRAMCGAPEFNPNVFNEETSVSVFNNPAVFAQYEPGSIFKPITMAMALDRQKVTAESTYTDTGEEKIGPHTIRNSDLKAHGVQTMTQVLEESLNTGAIFAMRQVGVDLFKAYVKDFGFGKPLGIELPNEAPGDISRLEERNEIYPATASFGQGITVTPLQMAAAFAAIANGGKLVQPTIVSEIRYANGEVERREPTVLRQVISSKTAAILAGMLVNVVERGHGQRAAAPGYYIAGKTGTAQIPRLDGQGYEEGATIGSFVGFGPVHNPEFVMIVRVDRPRDVQFAESSAAPLFGDVARFILQYTEVPPERSAR